MGKNKLKRFLEMKDLPHVIEPESYDLKEDISLKGNWNKGFFKNDNPIVLELGCGKGEYSVSLAKRYPNKNFIGIDIKGNRMWVGAKESFENNMKNIAFLRIRIENILKCFAKNEISEIWITFPDPQIKHKRKSKRLTHPIFLRKYNEFLKKDSLLHLKTDSSFLYGYTLGVIEAESHDLLDCTNDLYNVHQVRDNMDIKTHYEKIYIDRGSPITYTKFRLRY